MNERAAYERQFAEVSNLPAVAAYLELWRAGIAIAFSFDAASRQVLIGLSADETIEFLELHEVVYGGGRDARTGELRRHSFLRNKFDKARQQAWEDYQSGRLSPRPKQ
jgi:hypothetical protein